MADSIIKKPTDRINKTVNDYLSDKETMFDIHIHIFNHECVPQPFVKVRTSEVIMKKGVSTSPDTKGLVGYTTSASEDESIIENAYDFLKCYFRSSIDIIFREIDNKYKLLGKKVIYCVLMMDMEYGWSKWKIDKPYEQQVREMREFINKNDVPVLPFLAVDPRRPNVEKIFEQAFSEDKENPVPFFGIKVYPSLGYLPSDKTLMNIYAECEKYSIPVTAHCGSAIVRELKKTYDFIPFLGAIKANRRNDPQHWKKVLDAYPGLHLNLAHFGSTKAWDGRDWRDRQEAIVDMMSNQKYPNLYADFSFNMSEQECIEELVEKLRKSRDVADYTMYGSDFYMVNVEGPIQDKIDFFFDFFEEDPELSPYLENLTKINPRKFLCLDKEEKIKA